MAVLFWALNSVIPIMICQRVCGRKEHMVKWLRLSAVGNLLISVGVYSYYIGYSLQSYLAIVRGITPNGIYFSIMSVMAAVIITVYLLIRDKDTRKHGNDRTELISRTDKAVFVAAVLVSLVVRLAGFWWGGGMTFHPDEGNMVRDPIQMAEANTLMSDAVFYPAQISHKIQSVCFKLYEIFCRVFDMEYSTIWCYYIGRIYIALLSVGIVVCIFFIGNHLKNHAGTVACCLAAVFPPFVQTAHCITGDTVTAFFGCLAMLAALAYLRGTHQYWWLFMMSGLAAAATLEKWNGMMICGLIAVVVITNYCAECGILIRKLRAGAIVREGLFAVGSVLMMLVLIAPNLAGRLQELLDSISYIATGYEGDNTFWDNFCEYMMEFLSHSGVLCLPFFVMGIGDMWQNRQKELSVMSIGLISLIGMCVQNRTFVRWAYAFYICFILIISFGILAAWQSKLARQHMAGRAAVVAALVLVGTNLAAGTFFLDVIYTNSRRDTRIVSEKWCQQQGIRIEDCIYDDYTCWSPGGLPRYEVEWGKLGITSWIDHEKKPACVTSLGRRYAVVNKTQYPQSAGYVGEGTVKASFVSGCVMDGFHYDFYHQYSPKIYEPYSIYYCVKTGISILRGDLWIGSDIEIYDISSFPAYEILAIENMDVDPYGEAKKMYSGHIASISKGSYRVAVTGVSFSSGTFILEDEQGNRISEVSLTDGTAKIELPSHYYHVRCGVLTDESETFQEIVISTCESGRVQ